MLDYSLVAAQHMSYWLDASAENENSVNGFNGTWDIKEHSAIPCSVLNFIQEQFPRKEKITDIKIDDINRVLNQHWHGAGSMPTLILEAERCRQSRTLIAECSVHVKQDSTPESFVADYQKVIDHED